MLRFNFSNYHTLWQFGPIASVANLCKFFFRNTEFGFRVKCSIELDSECDFINEAFDKRFNEYIKICPHIGLENRLNKQPYDVYGAVNKYVIKIYDEIKTRRFPFRVKNH